MKLMAKPAEDRYQNAYGLKIDLETCLIQWNQTKTIDATFIPGQVDHSGRLSIPQKLYGREEELAQLREVFQLGKYGETTLLLISGNAGIGKSSLVMEFRDWVLENRGYYITGTFDQFKQDFKNTK